MGNQFRKAVGSKRNQLMTSLIEMCVSKKEERHLFQSTLTDLEEEYGKAVTDKKIRQEKDELTY
ncbi:Fur-regulated basic protein FbpA [Fictibacillus enclensis]|uniref:Fur-regulated basic protein FbpA n=1 Tax=Fictibacillus enclensis TaxID=1017270 RepID=UPI0025A01702|nr:Fur-regulated basic protein FbpA [Fictibacillus enclensis]MDM5197995.1 Fur-regulated basic protein FbpA [Fictibacillus enclensis]